MQDNTFEIKYNSFYHYLINNGYFFNKELIEDFLLSIKINPFIILFGDPGVGKTSLPNLFSDYLSISSKKEDIIIHAVNSLGKSHSNKEWHLKRDTLDEVLPVLPFEGKECSFTINDSFSSVGKFKLDPRFRFKDKNLINYLIQLQSEDPNQDLDLKIKIGEKSILSYCKYIYDIGPNFVLFDEKEVLGDSKSNLKSKNFNDIPKYDYRHYFFVFEDLICENESKYLQLIDSINLEDKYKDYHNRISLIGTVTNGNVKKFSQKFLDNVSVIELEHWALDAYLNNDINEFPEFNDLNYLEFKLFDEKLSNLNIYGLRNILRDIYSDNRNLWEILSEELCKFDSFFRNFEVFFNFRIVNDILKFMVASWKYEGKPYVWNNWERYFDSQIKSKLLPKIDSSFYSREIFEMLLTLCINGSNGKIMYLNSYMKITNLIFNLEKENLDYFNCFNHYTVSDILRVHEEPEVGDDEINEELENDIDHDDYIDVDDFDDVNEFVKRLTGWEKLIYESILDVNSILFSLEDLRNLERLKIYQFEDQSLDKVILENVNKLVDYGLISDLNNGFYKKEV